MDELLSTVIARANELAGQVRSGQVDPALLERTREATRRLYGTLEELPPAERRRAQRLVQDVATLIANAARHVAAQRPPQRSAKVSGVQRQRDGKPQAQPPTTAPPAAKPAGKPAVELAITPVVELAIHEPAASDWAWDVRRGIVWAAILGPPRGLDPGW